MIGTIFEIKNKDDVSILLNDHVTTPSQIIALQSYPQFEVDIKSNEVEREGQHGIWDFNSYYGKRMISFSGVIVGMSEADVETVKNKLMRVLSLPSQPDAVQNGYVTISWTDSQGASWQVEAKLNKDVNFDRKIKEVFRLDFNFTVKASDPYIYAQVLRQFAGVRGYTQLGATFPIILPATIGLSEHNVLSIENTGQVMVDTIIRLYGEDQGDITNPRIVNKTTGKTFQLNLVMAGADEYMDIDSKEGTVVDQDGNDRSADIDGASQFILLKQGVNDLVYKSDEDPVITLETPTALWTIKFRPAKI